MHVICLFIIFIIIINIFNVKSQMDGGFEEEDSNRQEQQVTLNRETVDMLLQTLGPNCRVELEKMLESQSGDVSIDCKIEIQNTLQKISGFNREAMEQQQQQQQEQSSRGKKKQSAAPSEPGGVHPAIYIFGFVIIAGISLVAFAYNMSSKTKIAEKKKLSKKKLEKQRIKEQSRR